MLPLFQYASFDKVSILGLHVLMYLLIYCHTKKATRSNEGKYYVLIANILPGSLSRMFLPPKKHPFA